MARPPRIDPINTAASNAIQALQSLRDSPGYQGRPLDPGHPWITQAREAVAAVAARPRRATQRETILANLEAAKARETVNLEAARAKVATIVGQLATHDAKPEPEPEPYVDRLQRTLAWLISDSYPSNPPADPR